ncbi:lectin [Chondromyces crocatus]|uniref:Uncharacterized protein n=1 Tax=Chondromyces crocatus TaxID=52 RepID=A0A0K1EB59_CHOCO|nr:lectin [Chondromyces crocatus]AKT38111.1 uncharacterized protein CMC5_022530 [Chondromyces crocatus]
MSFGGAFDFQIGLAPPRSTQVDVQRMSRGLGNIGLTCELASPDACRGYVADALATFQRELSPRGTPHNITAARAGATKEHEFQIVRDPQAWMDKVSVIMANAQWVRQNNIFAVDYDRVLDVREETQLHLIRNVFISVGLALGRLSGGHLNPDQLTKYLGDWISDLGSTANQHYVSQRVETLHIAHINATGTTTRVGGITFDYKLEVRDFRNKKVTRHRSSLEMERWGMTFNSGTILNSVFEQVMQRPRG